MDTIDRIYYINLDYRTDRQAQFESWISESGFPMEKVERISAIHLPDRPHLGCGQSHIKAIQTFLNSGLSNCIIFEDDYMALDPSTFWSNFQALADSKVEYDLIMCSYNALQADDGPTPFLKRVKFSYTASGYLLTRDFAPTLRDTLLEANILAHEEEAITHRKTDQYMNDVYWMKLMPTSRWYCFFPRLGIQRAGYSDLQKHFVEYNA